MKWNMIQNDAAEKNLSARKSHLSSEKIIHGAPFLEMEPADFSSSGYDENSGTYLTQVDASRGGTVKREFFEYHKTLCRFRRERVPGNGSCGRRKHSHKVEL